MNTLYNFKGNKCLMKINAAETFHGIWKFFKNLIVIFPLTSASKAYLILKL